jgi:hypothetical protein
LQQYLNEDLGQPTDLILGFAATPAWETTTRASALANARSVCINIGTECANAAATHGSARPDITRPAAMTAYRPNPTTRESL